ATPGSPPPNTPLPRQPMGHAATSARPKSGPIQLLLKFKTDHSDAQGLDTSDKDPQAYVSAIEAEISAGDANNSLGIGSLKGR
ncbi:MAG: hypothetical protein ACRDUW_24245, partial [Pseudonocardiaceae bacterium]